MCLGHRSLRWLACGFLGSAIALIGMPSARATIVRPGESVLINQGELPSPFSPTVLAETTKPFSVSYEVPAGFEVAPPQEALVAGNLISQVVRDAATGHLAFVYRFDFTTAVTGDEQSRLVLTDFGKFTTDVRYQSEFAFDVNRSPDGRTITQSRENGLAKLQTVAIFTNATDFDSRGTANMHLADELFLVNPSNSDLSGPQVLSGDVALSGLFQPATGASAIPLPGAVWAATAVLPLLALARRRLKAQRSA